MALGSPPDTGLAPTSSRVTASPGPWTWGSVGSRGPSPREQPRWRSPAPASPNPWTARPEESPETPHCRQPPRSALAGQGSPVLVLEELCLLQTLIHPARRKQGRREPMLPDQLQRLGRQQAGMLGAPGSQGGAGAALSLPALLSFSGLSPVVPQTTRSGCYTGLGSRRSTGGVLTGYRSLSLHLPLCYQTHGEVEGWRETSVMELIYSLTLNSL